MTPPAAAPSWVPRADWLQSGSDPSPAPGPAFVLALTLVGALLRLWSLTGQSLWVDEMLTWQAIRPGGDLGFLEQFLDTIQGPLYLAATWPLLHFRDNELMLRLPAAVAGILAIPLFAGLAGRMLGGRAARLALLLFALNPFLIWYSQEGRGYAFLLLMAIATASAYLALVRQGPTRWRAVGFGVAGAGMILSNLSGVFLLLAMGISLLVLHRPRGRVAWGCWILGFGLALGLTAPWLLKAAGIWAVDRIVPGGATGEALRGESTFSLLAVPYAVFTFFFGYSLGPSLRELHEPDRLAVILGYWPVLAAAGAAVGTVVVAGLVRPDRNRVACLIWIAVPFLLLVALAMRNVKPWNPRYVAVALPWLLLLAGAGLARLPRRAELALTALIAGLTLWSLAGYHVAPRYAKADLRQAAEIVAGERSGGRTVLVPVVTGVFGYYDRGRHELLGSYGRPPLRDRADADRYVAEVLAGRDRCVVVSARAWFFDPKEHLMPALARAGRLRLVSQVPGVRIYSWERRAATGGDHES